LVYLLGKIQSTLHIQQKQTSEQASKQTNKNQYPKTSTQQSLLLTYQEKFNPPHTRNNNIQANKHTKPKTSTYKSLLLLLLLLTYLEKFKPPRIHNQQHTRNPRKTQNPKQVVTNPFFLPT